MALERLAHYFAPTATGASADLVEHGLQVLIEPDSHDIPFHVVQCNTRTRRCFFQLRPRTAIERHEGGSSRGSADSSGSEVF